EYIVKLLLGKGADANAQGGKYGNALYAALEGGHELLDKGADVDAKPFIRRSNSIIIHLFL
ncbi:hypothetical protein K469DRAFT_546633, partial [Zopfia rhizophila CBS 207.26]